MLPLFNDHALSDEAAETFSTALVAIGAPQHTAPSTAQHLLNHSAGGGGAIPHGARPSAAARALPAPLEGEFWRMV